RFDGTEALGDIVYAELPDIGTELAAGDTAAAVESVKAASDVYSPISGTVTEKNTQVEANPSLINKSTYEHGELFLGTLVQSVNGGASKTGSFSSVISAH
uniref:Glycine cleavage system H protein, mitochondrial n=1 Tax=Parascaris equorum TaxID=6256 RepID=A0A914R7Y4_PAREQ